MKWTVKLVAEVGQGEALEREIATIEREDQVSAASIGLTIAEGKSIMEGLQRELVTAQMERHGAAIQSCQKCGRAFRTKGYYQSTLRSVYGKIRMRVRRIRGCSCSGSQGRTYSTLFTNKSPITSELRYLTAKMAALLPFGKAADFLGELLPLSAVATANTVRNRTMNIGKRLGKSAEVLATAATAAEEPCKDLVIGLDGGYVKSRHPRPERNFEIIAGKVVDSKGNATRFAFARNGGADGANTARLALRRCGANENTSVAFLTDGDAGLRAIHQQVAPGAEHILDWFHIAMRFTNLQQIAKGVSSLTEGGVRRHALAELERAKWRFWNGYKKKGLIGLVHLRQWALANCFDHIPTLKKLAHALSETIRYLQCERNAMIRSVSIR